jgi:YVTN family beta-propeller protein
MDRRPEGESSDPAICQDKVEAFIGGSLLSQPELDLNVYYVLALNDDASISVVDPLFGFGTTKLLDMIFLESPGEDWALTGDQATLYVSMPEAGRVAVASTSTWEVLANVDVGPRPSRVVLQGDEHYLWVGYDAPRTMPYWVEPRSSEASGVTVVDTRMRRVVREIPTGSGHHEIAFSGDDRWAFVTNQDDGTLSIIDVGKLEKIADVAVGREPVSLAYSAIAGAIYVTSREDSLITAVDAGSHQVVSRVETEPGLGQIKFAPGGRLALIVNTARDEVHVLDAASNRIVQTGDVEDGPDQVAFSDHLAYVRHRGSEIVLMIPLDQIGQEGLPVPVIDFPGGQRPFGRGSHPSLGDSIVQAPGATAVLVANPADQAIYFYKEGMAAPMGNFQNYGRQPRAVLAVDRSLRERSPGAYETIATLRRPGLYDVALFLDSPRTVHCFEVEVAEDPVLAAERRGPAVVRPLDAPTVALVGEKVSVRFQLVDPATEEPRTDLDDVRVLSFKVPGSDQRRQTAREVSAGVYEVEIVPERAGTYFVFVECGSLGLRINKTGFMVLKAKDATES